MTDLRSAGVPALGEDDHVRGPEGAPLIVEYADLECPYCAAMHLEVVSALGHDPDGWPVRWTFRHFPSRSSHPRAWAAAAAAEAAALQGRFWEMHDSLYEDQGHLEDPHLWDRARALGLDLDRFESDRRSDGVQARVRRDFQAGVRAGVATTPTVFHDGVAHTREQISSLLLRFTG